MITIHCGLHKTGSSSIQLALELCSKRGTRIVTPKPGDDLSENGWRERLSKVARAQDAVFSDENLLGSPYDGYHMAPERVAMLRDALGGFRYQIVVYLRPHIDWLPSVYLQGVQEGRTFGPDEFWTSVKNETYLRWENLMNLLQRESGAERVIARAHTRSRDAVADFFSVVGLGKPPRTGTTMIRENVSIGAAQAPLLRELNSPHGMSDGQHQQFRKVFQQFLALETQNGLSPFPEVLQSEIAIQLKSDWIHATIHSSSVEESQVFQRELPRYEASVLPFAGYSLNANYVGEEALRCIRVLALNKHEHDESALTGALRKLLKDPIGAPQAALRRISRWWG
jgi:hypothetical protein